jgi:hypothetical protein
MADTGLPLVILGLYQAARRFLPTVGARHVVVRCPPHLVSSFEQMGFNDTSAPSRRAGSSATSGDHVLSLAVAEQAGRRAVTARRPIHREARLQVLLPLEAPPLGLAVTGRPR